MNAGRNMDRPLAGLLVVDLSQYIAGPFATMLMADAGATVLKVESPQGDATRALEPIIHGPDGDVSAFYLRMNRGKKSVVLDLKTVDGKEALAALIAKADVLVENYRAGVLARLGFGEERLRALNPRLVYCSISGFGHSPSPERDRVAYNTVAEYETGIYRPAGPNGEMPGSIGPPVGDMFPALHALAGLLMALYRRSVTGEGAHVDIALYDSMLSLNELRSSTAILAASDRQLDGRAYFCPYGVFAVRDGYICLDVTTERQWRGFCRVIGRPELAEIPGMDTGPRRAARYDELIRAPLEAWLAECTRDAAARAFLAESVPVSVLREPREALLSEQATARAMRIEVGCGSGVGASVTVPGNPIRVDPLASDERLVDPEDHFAPELGADTHWALTEIAGLGADAIARLCGGLETED